MYTNADLGYRFAINLAIAILLALTVNDAARAADLPERATIQVIRVLDGDTFVGRFDSTTLKMDLLGAVAPLEDLDQPHHDRSKTMLRELIDGKRIEVQFRKLDGRPKVIAMLDGKSINVAMIEKGAAWYRWMQVESERLKQAEQLARQRGAGLWSLPDPPVAPWEYQHHLETVAEERKAEAKGKMIEFTAGGMRRIGGLTGLKSGRVSFTIPGGSSSSYSYETALTVTWQLPDRIAFRSVSTYERFPFKRGNFALGLRDPNERSTTVVKRRLVLNGEKAWRSTNGEVGEASSGDIHFAADILRGIGEVRSLTEVLDSPRYTVELRTGSRRVHGLDFIPTDNSRASPFALLYVGSITAVQLIEIGPLAQASSSSVFAASLFSHLPTLPALVENMPGLQQPIKARSARLIIPTKVLKQLGYQDPAAFFRSAPGSPPNVFATLDSIEFFGDQPQPGFDQIFKTDNGLEPETREDGLR